MKKIIKEKIIKVKEKKKKKLTVTDLKKKLSVGTKLTLIKFQREVLNISRVVEEVKPTYVLLSGEGINPFKLYCLKYPKASELTETEDGFIIDTNFSKLRYKWDVDVNDQTNN